MNIKIYNHIAMVMGVVSAFILTSCGLLAPQQSGSRATTTERREQTLLVGTYTSDQRSEGVYAFSYHPTTRVAKHKSTLITPNPTALAMDHRRSLLYIANQLPDEAMVSVAELAHASTRLTPVNSVFSLGNDPRAIATDGRGKVVCANYSTGSITLFKTDERGALQEADWHIVLGDNGVSHPTSLCFSLDGKELFVVDQGQDKLFHFFVNRSNPPLTIDIESTDLPKGSMPRVLIMDSTGKYAYLLTETSPTIYIYRHKEGKLTKLQQIAIAKDSRAKGMHIALSGDGRYLYASQQARNGAISIFSVDKATGLLTKVDEVSVGNTPLHFAINPSDTLLAVACEKSGQIEFYSRDKKSGLLQPMKDLGISLYHPAYLLWSVKN